MAMNSKDFTVEAAKAFLEKQYPSTIGDETLTEADKIYNEKLASSAREKIKNPSSKVWDSLIKKQAIIGGDTFPLSPENTKALGRAVEDDVFKATTGTGKSRTMIEMLAKMTPEARADVIARPDVMKNIEGSIAKAAPIETPYGKSFLSYTPEGKIKMIEDLKSVTKSDAGRGLGSLGRKLVGPAVAAGEVAAGENDIGKLAAGYVGADVMGELGAAAGGLLGKGPGAVAGALGGSIGGYAAGQKLYDKYAPEGVKKAMSISPEERFKIKQLLQDLKSKAKLTK